MNKKVITLFAAALLFGGAGVNVAYAALSTPTEVAITTPLELKDGVSFFLKSNSSYLTTKEITTKEGNKYVTLDIWNSSIPTSVDKAFTVKKSTFGFELWQGDKKLVFLADGNAASDNVEEKKLSSIFTANATTTAFTAIYLLNENSANVAIANGGNTTAVSLKKDWKAEDLDNENMEGTTLSFDVEKSLIGNLFVDVVPVELGQVNDLIAHATHAQAGTYFVKGTKEAIEKFKTTVNKENASELEFLAISVEKDLYNINGKVAGEGRKLRWMPGKNLVEKIDSTKLAAFALSSSDLLNSEELNLTMPGVADIAIKAVTTSGTDANSYVTTVSSSTKFTNTVNPTLGSEKSFISASELIKAEMNTVNVYFTSGTPETGEYHKYLIATSDNTTAVKPANEVDFTLPEAQWVVAGFNGEYTFTLTNRLTGKDLVVKLNKTENEGEYKIVSVAASNYSQIAANAGAGSSIKELVGTTVMFNTIVTTKNDGYVAFTENQMKNGVYFQFSGKDANYGEQTFFAVNSSDVLKGSLKDDNIVALYPERVKGAADNSTESLRGKEDYVLNITDYAVLDGEKIVSKKDTLVVPTYILRAEAKTGEDAKYLNASLQLNQSTSKTTNLEVALAKAADGSLYMKKLSNVGKSSYANATAVNSIAQVSNPNKGVGVITFANSTSVFNKLSIVDAVSIENSLPAVPGHYTFDNVRGSINTANIKGINEGALSSKGLVFWLDTADIEKEVPSFYISYGIKDSDSRMYMFNTADSAKVFDEASASYKYNKVYYYGENEANDLKVAYTTAKAEEGKDLAEQFKFNIVLAQGSSDEYNVVSVKDGSKVAQKNGVVILSKTEEPMAFTVNKAEAPTSNESVVASEVKVVANNGSVVVKNAAGKNVVVSTILGQVVANEVLTSDNATINVPAGIVVVAVDGESFKVSVK